MIRSFKWVLIFNNNLQESKRSTIWNHISKEEIHCLTIQISIVTREVGRSESKTNLKERQI
jgi:hypothetical protein